MASNTVNLNTYKAKILSNTYGANNSPIYFYEGVPTILTTIGGEYEPVWVDNGVITAITAGTTAEFYRGDKSWSNTLTDTFIIDNGGINGELIKLVSSDNKIFSFKFSGSVAASNADIGWDWTNIDGAGASFRSTSWPSEEGEFRLFARKKDSNNNAVYTQLIGTPGDITNEGVLSWGGSISIGTRGTTTGPSSITYSNRITIIPYFHTGGPWYIKSGDDSTNAYLALYYNTTQLMRIKHDGTQMIDWKGNASTATKWASAQTVYVTLGTASKTTTIQGGSSSAHTLGVDGTLGVGNGGTGKASWTKGGIIYASATNTLAQIADGSANKVLRATASATYSWLSYTSANTASTLVYRDTSGNFSAGTVTAALSGNATTCSYPAGFNSRGTGATWGNTTGTSITYWGESDGGCIDFRKNNPSAGKISIKVDGRFYGNEGTYPAMLMNYKNNYWGMGDPDAGSGVWIRTTTQGIIPYQSGAIEAGHCGLGTSSWFFSTSYIDSMHTHQLIVEGTTNATMTSASTNPRITFQEGTSTQPVHLIYTDYDNYRGPAGLKVIGGASATPAWFEVEGDYYGRGINLFPKDLANYNEGLRIHCSNGGWATFMLCGTDNTGGTGTSTNSWGIFNNNGTLYINKATSSGAGNPRVYANANGWYFTKAYGAVWNDFAEYRQADINEPGRVVIPSKDGIARLSTERLQSGGRIISDTYGFAVGESDRAKTPVGLSGRVLAYPYQNLEKYQIGDAVCTAPNGTIDVMTREEIMIYPERILGIVNEIPNYDIWEETLECPGGEPSVTKVKVKGRIWIDIK